ncbi:hypothetical protein EDC01DRAFT_631726 [Geopyxis carbonaria]|nr:hypothetical protein EDC01DRAFT_631726 [Geopyxis carbonaria]
MVMWRSTGRATSLACARCLGLARARCLGPCLYEYALCIVTVATPSREVVLGQVVLLRASLKLLSFASFCEGSGRDTKKLFGKVDGKVWKLVANPKPPHIYTDPNEEHSRLSLRYSDGFPDDWKDSDELVKKQIASFRIYARFWYHIIYESTPGNKLSVHQTELPADHPTTEVEALRQVGSLYNNQPIDPALSLASPNPPPPRPPSLASVAIISSKRSSREPSEDLPTPRQRREGSVPDPTTKPEIMPATTLPTKIKSKNVLAFNGIPGKVASLDISVEDMCSEHDYPAYYGGTVLGNFLNGYEYVEPGTPGSASNYHFGTRLCSSITGKFVDNARMWWEDYRKYGAAKPNCWKRSELNPDGCTKPPSIEEISLFDILKKYFPEENDEVEAALELKRYKWNPTAKDAVPFSTFTTYLRSLALRAGYEKWKQRMPLIVDCIEPASLRVTIRLYDDEEQFWSECRTTINSWLNFHPNASPNDVKCGNCGGAHTTNKCKRNTKGSGTTTQSSSRTDAVCDWCNKTGHYKNECLKLRGQISRGEVPADERNRRGGPPAAPAASGHSASVCPTRSTTAAAATKLVDNQKQNNSSAGDSASALYYMDTWTPRPSTVRHHVRDTARLVAAEERIDELFSTRYADQLVEFPVFNNITSPTDSVEVIDNVLGKTAKTSVVKVSDAIDMSALGPTSDECPTGPVWTISSTLRGQDMLTIFDTGAVKAAVPVSTANGSRCPWTRKLPHKLTFIKADGSRV